MKLIPLPIILVVCLALMSGCLQLPVHQGNVLQESKLLQIQNGDSKFRVESLLGSPVMKDTLYPNRATYIEYFEDPETGDNRSRGIQITYDDALRVTHIWRFGFEPQK